MPRQPCTGLVVVSDGGPHLFVLESAHLLSAALHPTLSTLFFFYPLRMLLPRSEPLLDLLLLLSTPFLSLSQKSSLLLCSTKPHQLMTASFLSRFLHLLGQVVSTLPSPLNFNSSVSQSPTPHSSLGLTLFSLYLNSNTSPQFLSLAGHPLPPWPCPSVTSWPPTLQPWQVPLSPQGPPLQLESL